MERSSEIDEVDGLTPLEDGDVIGVGSVKLTVKVLQPTQSTETQQMQDSADDT